jgi:glycosyltransferase involved in cell wall biosynthesis
VVSQTLKNIEIVLVNNGSTDSSINIMEEYQAKYPETIKIISQKDMGLAQGRQTGINYANGEYITFLDADDYVTNDAYEKLYTSAMKHNVDIVECQTLREGAIIESNYQGVQVARQVLKDYFVNGDIPPMMWMRLYKNNLFDQPVFPDIYVNNEDIFAFPYLLNKANKILYLKEQLHFYTTDNETSVMNVIRKRIVDEEKIIANRIKPLHVIKHLESKLGSHIIQHELSREFKIYTARVILEFCLNDYKSLNQKDCLEIALKNTGANINDIKSCYKHLKYNNKSIQKSVNILGLKKTVSLFRIMSKIQKTFLKST